VKRTSDDGIRGLVVFAKGHNLCRRGKYLFKRARSGREMLND
jgi:hypothetical protein